MKNILIALVVLVVLAGVYFGRDTLKTMLMGSGEPTPQAQMTPEPSATPEAMSGASGTGSTASGNVKEFTVKLTEFAFAPKTMSVSKGDTVKIVFTNDGKFQHDFTITELNVKSKILQVGESDTVTFTADKAGTFQYFCSVGTHKEKGMVGTLTVQ